MEQGIFLYLGLREYKEPWQQEVLGLGLFSGETFLRGGLREGPALCECRVWGCWSGEYLVSSVAVVRHSESNLGRKGLI